MEVTIEGYTVELLLEDTRTKKLFVVKALHPNPKSDETTIVSMKARIKNKKTKRFNNIPVTPNEAEGLEEIIFQMFHGPGDDEEE